MVDQNNSSLPFDLKLGIILGVSAVALAAIGIFIFRKIYLTSSDKFQNRLADTTFGTLQKESFHPFVKRTAAHYDSGSLNSTPNMSVAGNNRPSVDEIYDSNWRGYYEPEPVVEGQLNYNIDVIQPTHYGVLTKLDSHGNYVADDESILESPKSSISIRRPPP
ncbi:hypothetical protein HDV06_005991 [Boothiomyces sp. JEL0866]|nr:hypothetical protein HDV06_005991 [Boothiomyces sp. JEL0866]